MIRPALTEMILFIAPFVLYALYLFATRSTTFDPQHWPLSRIITLAILALMLLIGSFFYFAHFSGAPPGSTYIPAHIENGKFVPGTIK
ncbi:MAG: DUF6111 family protein [Pseudolabrys sp.]|jgi:hypothetical protein